MNARLLIAFVENLLFLDVFSFEVGIGYSGSRKGKKLSLKI